MKILILTFIFSAAVSGISWAAPTPTPTPTPAPTATPDPEVRAIRDALRSTLSQLNTKVPGFVPVPTP